jgi:hypothetical protein
MLPHAGVAQSGERVEGQARQHADLAQRGNLDRHLQDAAHKHGDRHRIDRLRQVAHQEQRGEDEGHVQQHRRKGRHLELAPCVEHAARQRDEGHEGDVGKHQPRHPDRGVEGVRGLVESARNHQYQQRAGDDAYNTGQHRGPHQGRGDMVDQGLGGLHAVLGLVFGQDRDEGLREGALGKQPAQQVGNAKRDDEGVRIGRGAESAREQALAQ